MTYEERVQVLEREHAGHSERLDRMERLLERVIEANNSNAVSIGHLSAKIDQFVDAVFHRGGDGTASTQ